MGSIGNDGSGWQKNNTGTHPTFSPWYSQRQYGQYPMQSTLGGYQQPYLYNHYRHYPALFPTSTGSPQSQLVKPPSHSNIPLDHARATPSGTYFNPTRPAKFDRSADAEQESDDGGLSQVVEDDGEGKGDVGPTSSEKLREAKDLWDLRWSRWWGYNWSRKRDEAMRKQRVQMSRAERLDRRSRSSSASVAGSREDSQQRGASCASVENCVSSKRFPNLNKSEQGSDDDDETPASRESDSPSTIRRRVWQRFKRLCINSKARAHALRENLANRRHSLFKKNQGKKLKEENLIDLDTNTNRFLRPLIPDYLMEAEPKKRVRTNVPSPSGAEHENKNLRQNSFNEATGIALDKTSSCKKLKEFELEPRRLKYFNSSDTSLATLEHLAMRLEQLKKTDDLYDRDKYSKPKHNKSGVSFNVSKRSTLNVSRGTSPISIFSAKPNRMTNSRAQEVYQLMVDKPTVPTMVQCLPTETLPNTLGTSAKPDFNVDHVTGNHVRRTRDMNRPHLTPREQCMPNTYLKQPSPHNVYVQSPLVTSPHTPITAATIDIPLRDIVKDIRTKEAISTYNADEERNSTYPYTAAHNSCTLDNPQSTVNCQASNDIPTNKLRAPHRTKENDSLPPEIKMGGNDVGIAGNHKAHHETNTPNQKGEEVQKPNPDDFLSFQRARDFFKADKPLIPNPFGNYRLYKPRVLPSYSGPPLLSPLLRNRVLSPSPSILSSTMSSFLFPHHPSTYCPFPFMSPWLTPNSNLFDDQGSVFPRKSRAETSDRQLRSMSTQTYEETFSMIDQQYQKLRSVATSDTAVNTKPTCSKTTQTESLENIFPLQNTKPPTHVHLQDTINRCHQATSTHFTESRGTQTNLDEYLSKQTLPSNSESSLTQPKMVYQWLATSHHGRPSKSRRDCVHERRNFHRKTSPVELSEAHMSIVHEKGVTSNHNEDVVFAKNVICSSSSFTSLSNMADFTNASTIAIKSSRGICTERYLNETPLPTSNEKHMVYIDYESLPEIKSSEEFETVQTCKEIDKTEDQATQTTKCSRKKKIKLFFRRKLASLSSNSE